MPEMSIVCFVPGFGRSLPSLASAQRLPVKRRNLPSMSAAQRYLDEPTSRTHGSKGGIGLRVHAEPSKCHATEPTGVESSPNTHTLDAPSTAIFLRRAPLKTRITFHRRPSHRPTVDPAPSTCPVSPSSP